MRFVIVTGMSGSGKLTAMKMLEDMGFFCVDNLPVPLIEKFIELANTPGSEITKVALGLDVRADQKFADAFKELERLKKNGLSYELIFMEASDKVLVKRYKETRRKHPLAGDGSIEEGIEKEREILKKVRKKADDRHARDRALEKPAADVAVTGRHRFFDVQRPRARIPGKHDAAVRLQRTHVQIAGQLQPLGAGRHRSASLRHFSLL